MVNKGGRLNNKGKFLIVIIISMFFIVNDLMAYYKQRTDNIYWMTGLHRGITHE